MTDTELMKIRAEFYQIQAKILRREEEKRVARRQLEQDVADARQYLHDMRPHLYSSYGAMMYARRYG